MMSDRSFQFFLQFHQGTPRQGPGTPEATTRALRRIEPLLPPSPAVLDLACGSGGQTLTLATLLPSATFLALDVNPAFIEELHRKLAERGLQGRVAAQVADANELRLAPGSFDLVWCEGSMFVLGFERGLRMLRPLLRGSGLAVVSEAAWMRPLEEVPPQVLAFWREAYPAMTDVEGTLALARSAGFAVLDHFRLPDEGWFAYVDAVERRMDEVMVQHAGDPDAEKAAASERREIAMFRQNLRHFGYEFLLLRSSAHR